MSFTEAQIEALDALEEAFGPTETDAARVKVDYLTHYEGNAQTYTGYVLDNYASWKLAADPEFAEAQRKALEEQARKRALALAERAGEKRESMILSFLSGLMPKTNRELPDSQAELEIGKEIFSLHVSGWKYSIDMEYNRETFTLETVIFSQGHDIFSETEDMTLVHGNASPREQIKGYKAVVDFLEGSED